MHEDPGLTTKFCMEFVPRKSRDKASSFTGLSNLVSFTPLPLPAPVCWHFRAKGSCPVGDACLFSHVSQNINARALSKDGSTPDMEPLYWLHRITGDVTLLVNTLEAHGWRCECVMYQDCIFMCVSACLRAHARTCADMNPTALMDKSMYTTMRAPHTCIHYMYGCVNAANIAAYTMHAYFLLPFASE